MAAAFIADAWIRALDELKARRQDLDRAIYGILERHFRRIDLVRVEAERAAMKIVSAKRGVYTNSLQFLELLNPMRVLADDRGKALRLEARLDAAAQRRIGRDVRALDGQRNSLDRSAARLMNSVNARLQASAAALRACDPRAPLARGYAIVTAGGRALRDASSLRPGDEIAALLERGTLTARVEAIRDDG
jgi:exodeoxyribonuclease VII large subunit